MFSIGDMVVHPMHGAGIINAIVRQRIGNSDQDYYVFKMSVGGLLLKIPTANSQIIGLRAVEDTQTVEQVLDAIPSLEIEDTANWNKRYRENMMRLKSGDLYEVARVIKCLMHRDLERGLSTGERKMLHNAKQILISEVVLIESADYTKVEERLDQAMLQDINKS